MTPLDLKTMGFFSVPFGPDAEAPRAGLFSNVSMGEFCSLRAAGPRHCPDKSGSQGHC
jgi:hypothetical protein